MQELVDVLNVGEYGLQFYFKLLQGRSVNLTTRLQAVNNSLFICSKVRRDKLWRDGATTLQEEDVGENMINMAGELVVRLALLKGGAYGGPDKVEGLDTFYFLRYMLDEANLESCQACRLLAGCAELMEGEVAYGNGYKAYDNNNKEET